MPYPNLGRYMLGNQTNGNIHPPSTTSSTMKKGGKRKSKSSQKRQTQTKRSHATEPGPYTQKGSRYYVKKTRHQTRKRGTNL
jgi:hypothetical protein